MGDAVHPLTGSDASLRYTSKGGRHGKVPLLPVRKPDRHTLVNEELIPPTILLNGGRAREPACPPAGNTTGYDYENDSH